MSEAKATTKVMTFQECINLAACPYCRRKRGEKCWSKGSQSDVDWPHKSRASVAYDVKWGKSEAATG